MKSTFFALGALAAAVTAQDIASLPACGQTCANNMMAASKAAELKCTAGDMKCLCQNNNFVFGLRDCSKAICDGDGASKVLNYAMAICKAAGVTINAGGDGSNGNNGGNNGNNGGNNGASAHVTTIYSTVTDKDGKVQTTAVATSTISGGDANQTGGASQSGANGSGASTMVTVTSGEGAQSTGANGSGSETGANGSQTGANGSQTGANGSQTDANGSGAMTTGGSGSQTGANGATGSGSGTGKGGASSTSSGLGAQMTAAPAGILAAAGLAGLFL